MAERGRRCCLKLYEQFSHKKLALHKMPFLIHGMPWYIYFIDQLFIILVNELVVIAENRAVEPRELDFFMYV